MDLSPRPFGAHAGRIQRSSACTGGNEVKAAVEPLAKTWYPHIIQTIRPWLSVETHADLVISHFQKTPMCMYVYMYVHMYVYIQYMYIYIYTY